MSEILNQFLLIGARISQLSINEEAVNDQAQLQISIGKEEATISDSKYGDRAVIEIKIKVQAVGVDQQDDYVTADSSNTVVSAELAAGFVGTDQSFDGDLKAFQACQSGYHRFAYWMLRERLVSILSVTVLRTTFLPWDLNELDLEQSEGRLKGVPSESRAKPKRPAKKKRQSTK